MLTTEQFDRTRKLALRLAGIELCERHRDLLASRSRRLRISNTTGIEALLGAAEEGDPLASRQLIGLVTTNFTGFFRHPWHFEVAAEQAARAVRHRGQARLWSAAAATGEEPYSLAMALIEVFGRDDPPATILATDIDTEALAIGAKGEYGDRSLQTLSLNRRARFFAATGGTGRQRIIAAVNRLVECRTLNLISKAWKIEGPFDVIFCRNVLMYLESRHRCAVLERLAALLAADGLLMIDPTEHLGKAGHLFTPVADAVYRRRGAS